MGKRGSHPPAAVEPSSNGNGASAPVAEPKKRLNPIKRKQMEDRYQQIEQNISRLEASIAHCESELQNFVSAEETQRLTRDLNQHRSELQSLMAEWEQLAALLENA